MKGFFLMLLGTIGMGLLLGGVLVHNPIIQSVGGFFFGMWIGIISRVVGDD